MATIDWLILLVCSAALCAFSVYSARFMRSVADFLAANRAGGRYMMSIADGMSRTGAISAVAMFEMYMVAGFPPLWWNMMTIPVTAVIILTGWVYYRFRETRCLTMAQFFEVRYSRKFRIYAGIVTWLSGVVNFGIFPIVEARFFMYFLQLPSHFEVAGVSVSTVALVMFCTLGLSTAFAVLGGHITVMLTDCAQGIFCMFVYLAVSVYLLNHFEWFDIMSSLQTASLPRKSMFDPFDTANVSDFNAWYFLIAVVSAFYGYMSWQGSAAFQASGISPHEQKMAQIIGTWRQLPQTAMLVLLPICAFALLHLDHFAPQAENVNAVLSTIENPQIRTQMTTPVAMTQMLPSGIKGLMCVVMLFFLITTQDAYLHSWGSMFVQDVIMPLRKNPLRPTTHVLLLRLSIIFVSLFAFFFGLYFVQTKYILMYFAITGAIVAGAGAVIVGGLYWRRGTVAAAWISMTIGWGMAIGSIVLSQVQVRWFADVPAHQRSAFIGFLYWANSINGQVTYFWTMVACLASYVLVSVLIPSRQGFDLQRMLHRDGQERASQSNDLPSRRWWSKVTGFSTEFSRVDRWLAIAMVTWNFGWFAIFVISIIAHWLFGIPTSYWPGFWRVWVWTNVGIGVPVTIWFTFGGIRDIRELFVRLRLTRRDATDDGWVTPKPAGSADATEVLSASQHERV